MQKMKRDCLFLKNETDKFQNYTQVIDSLKNKSVK